MTYEDIITKNRKIVASFRVGGGVVPKKRPKFTTINGFARAYTDKDTRDYETLVKLAYQQQCGIFFGDLPLFVEVRVAFASNSDKAKFSSEFNTQPYKKGYVCQYTPNKKDLDNIYKSILDGLLKICMYDDNQVIQLNGTKGLTVKGEEFVDVTITAYERYLTYDNALLFSKIEKLNERITKLKEELKTMKKTNKNGEVVKKFYEITNRYQKAQLELNEKVELFYNSHTKYFEDYGTSGLYDFQDEVDFKLL